MIETGKELTAVLEMEFTSKSVIILAEDDPGHARLIQHGLARSGIRNQIVHAENGRELLDMLEDYVGKTGKAPPAIVLMDIRMPVMNGIEALKHIREKSLLSAMPVIMLSTSDDPGDVTHSYRAGCNAYVSKPVDFGEFKMAMTDLARFIQRMEVPYRIESHG